MSLSSYGDFGNETQSNYRGHRSIWNVTTNIANETNKNDNANIILSGRSRGIHYVVTTVCPHLHRSKCRFRSRFIGNEFTFARTICVLSVPESTLLLITLYLAISRVGGCGCVYDIEIMSMSNEDSCIVTYLMEWPFGRADPHLLICLFSFSLLHTSVSSSYSLTHFCYHVTFPRASYLWECVCQIDETLIPMELFNVRMMSPNTTMPGNTSEQIKFQITFENRQFTVHTSKFMQNKYICLYTFYAWVPSINLVTRWMTHITFDVFESIVRLSNACIL